MFIPTRDNTNAAEFAELFHEQLECRFGSPRGIVSDRDSRLTSEFWSEVCHYSLIKRRMSTAFHPQTDGQSETLNRIIEDYLRAYVNEDQSSWAKLLPTAAFAYNSSKNHSTHVSPNKFLYGHECEMHFQDTPNQKMLKTPAARDRIKQLHMLRNRLRDDLAQSIKRTIEYYDSKHVPKQFKRGELVKLSTKNLQFKNKKLQPRWIGPFRILKRIGGQAYHLVLPNQYSRLHPVFPIQLLESYNPRPDEEPLPMPPLDDQEDNQWEVEQILDEGRINGCIHYLIKWAGWPAEYNSWVPQNDVAAPDLIESFRQRKRKRS